MAYADSEVSVEASQPVELYQIVIDTETFRYTTQEKNFTLDGQEYLALALTRSGNAVGPETRRDNFEVRLPGNNPFVQKYPNFIPGTRATLTVFRFQRGEGAAGADLKRVFEGTVLSVGWEEDGSIAVLSAQPIIGAFQRQIPRRTYSSGCNHTLYAPTTCRVVRGDSAPDLTPYQFLGVVASVSGGGQNIIVVTGADTIPDGWFTAGQLEAASGQDVRLIRSHIGDVITISTGFPFSIVGASVTLQAGCGHDPTTCAVKFANFVNYGGAHAVPRRNVFSSGVV